VASVRVEREAGGKNRREETVKRKDLRSREEEERDAPDVRRDGFPT